MFHGVHGVRVGGTEQDLYTTAGHRTDRAHDVYSQVKQVVIYLTGFLTQRARTFKVLVLKF